MDTADALPGLQAVAPLNDPFVGDCELAEAVEVALLLEEGTRIKGRDHCASVAWVAHKAAFLTIS